MSLYNNSSLTPESSGAVDSSLVLTVRSKSDLPDPIAGVITSPDNTTLIVVEKIDLGTDRLVIGPGGSITGIRRNGGAATVISGTTTEPLVTIANSGDYFDIGFNQLGSGDVLAIDGLSGPLGPQLIFARVAFEGGKVRIVEGFANSFITCDFTLGAGVVLGGSSNSTFLGFTVTSGFFDEADGDVAILIESGAVLERLLVDTTGFAIAFASKGIVVENGAVVQFLEVLNAGFNFFNAGATGIELADPDTVELGLLINVTSGPTLAPVVASNPEADSQIAIVSAVDIMILNGNLWVAGANGSFTKYVGISNTVDTVFTFGTNLMAITNDGVNVIVADDSTNLITVMVGESNTVDFSFATPASDGSGLAFDGQDIWLTDSVANTIYHLDGKSLTIKNSWPAVGTPVGIDLDGTVVMVADVGGRVDVHKPDGTFLYDFTIDGSAGIAHQEDQYLIGNPGNSEINVFSKKYCFS